MIPGLSVTTVELIAAFLFGLAVLHTFSTRYFEHLAHTQPNHAGLWHLLGEVETVFGLWAMLLLGFMALAHGWGAASDYLDSRHFVEPVFVFVIMVIAASRPIMQVASDAVAVAAQALPLSRASATYFLSLSLVPLLGSLITEPAAMTLAALMLRDQFLARGISTRFMYATVGALFVNVSIGGTLTNFAAPPVLMVAAKWDWSTAHMFTTMGWKALLAVMVNALALTIAFRHEVERCFTPRAGKRERVPLPLVVLNLALLTAVVLTNHDPEVFVGAFLVFLGFAEAYRRHHDPLLLRQGLMVAFFLGGLVVIGGQQKWWLEQVLVNLDGSTLFFGAAALTAITDNAALTYLGSLVDGVSEEFKYAPGRRRCRGRWSHCHCECAEPGRLRSAEGLVRRTLDQSDRAVPRRAAADGGCDRCALGPEGTYDDQGSFRSRAVAALVFRNRPLVPVSAYPAVRGRRSRSVGGADRKAG